MPYVTDAELVEIVPDLRALAAAQASAEVREPTMLSSYLPYAKTTADNRCPCCGGSGVITLPSEPSRLPWLALCPDCQGRGWQGGATHTR